MASKKELNPNKTILTIVTGFLVIYLITNAIHILWAAIWIGFLGIFSSFISLKIHNLWMGLSTILSYIIPPIILSIIFFTILFPIAFLSRLFGEKDPLQLKRTDKSLFKTINRTFSKDTFEKTW